MIFKSKDGKRIVVPVHQGKDIPKGTLNAILKDAKISVDELIEKL
ncbi:MAG: type II toxin-antitoxin system HicA family toxin [Patescibacteria group bacterium]